MPRKISILSLLFFLPVLTLHGQFRFEQVTEQWVGPGMRYFKVIEKTQPWSIDVLTIDLTNPYLKIESVKGYEVLTRTAPLTSRERTTSMAARNSAEGRRVAAAINADFFETTGEPVNLQVEKGEIVRMPIARSLVGVTLDNKPILDRMKLDARVAADTFAAAINAVNSARANNKMVLYNHFYGNSTGTNEWGTEVLLTPLNAWMVNDTVMCVVDTVIHRIGNMAIPREKVVLSGHGTAEQFIETNLQPGDSIRLYLGLSPVKSKIKELVGGMPRIIRNGQSYVDQGVAEEGGANMANVRHPRTAVGFNQDSTRLFLVVVDGRQPALSNGMTFPELADYMMSLGVYEGVNLDGGGSSTMVIRDKIVNSPSDGSERAVANALLVISTAPRREADHLDITPRSQRILEGTSCLYKVIALDTFYNYIDTDPAHFNFHVDPRLGSITAGGVFTAGSSRDSGFVHFSHLAVHDSAYVVVKTLELMRVVPRHVTTDSTHAITLKVETRDSDGGTTLPVCTWTSTNPVVGTISSTGIFTPRRSGETTIIVEACGLSDTARVTVAVGRDGSSLDTMESLLGWSISGSHIDSAACSLSLSSEYATQGTSALRLEYQFTYDGYENWLYLNRAVPIWGTPDSILIDVRLDSMLHGVYVFANDDDGDLIKYVPRKRASKTNEYNTVGFATNAPYPVDPSATDYFFPLTFASIGVKLAGTNIRGHTYRGVLYFDNLRITYPVKTAVSQWNPMPDRFVVMQNYPNPFNSDTKIRLYNDRNRRVAVRVFDSLGKQCATIYQGNLPAGEHAWRFDASHLASGVYFVAMEPAIGRAVKMVLLR